jgi:hypothetical protein
MLTLENEAQLAALHTGNVKEGLTLEYKASAAIDKRDDAKKIEMARDVSAFANAEGGQIVYGMTENDHSTAGLDEGIDPRAYPEIWFEQILQQHVTPNIEGIRPRHISLQNGNVAVVMDIPASKGDPHQASDGKYYRRHNFNRLAMEHYEVRDAFRRTTTPDLLVDLAFEMGSTAHLLFRSGMEVSIPIIMLATILNRAPQPAFHAFIKIGIDTALLLNSAPDFYSLGITGDEQQQYWLARQFTSPPGLPIFKEMEPGHQFRFQIGFTVHSSSLHGERLHHLSTSVLAPGCISHTKYKIHQRGPMLEMCPPGHHFNR